MSKREKFNNILLWTKEAIHLQDKFILTCSLTIFTDWRQKKKCIFKSVENFSQSKHLNVSVGRNG